MTLFKLGMSGCDMSPDLIRRESPTIQCSGKRVVFWQEGGVLARGWCSGKRVGFWQEGGVLAGVQIKVMSGQLAQIRI